MALMLCQFGGRITAGAAATSPEVEIWSCSLALLVVPGYFPPDHVDFVAAQVNTWFQAPDTKIDETVTLDFVKLNEYDLLTGHQITDPTVEHIYTSPPRGSGTPANKPPTSLSYRVSIDNGTRNRRTRGGFYVPRTTLTINPGGRFQPSELDAARGTAVTMLDALTDGNGAQVGVWSRADKSVTAATRLRLGDVPDNVSRRRNKLREVYSTVGIT